MPVAPRIVSLLPSATEMVYALGLQDQLLGVTHECDYPADAQSKAVVVRNVLPVETMSDREIDIAVSEHLRLGLDLYAVDETLFRNLEPNLILTQNLCQVCVRHRAMRLRSCFGPCRSSRRLSG